MSDPAFTCHFLDAAAFRVAEDARMALGKRRGADSAWLVANKTDYGWASLSEVVAPCAMWYSSWYYDPADPDKSLRRDAALRAIADGTFGDASHNYYLSKMYWQQWSDKRPPICSVVSKRQGVVRRCEVLERRRLDCRWRATEDHLQSVDHGSWLSWLPQGRRLHAEHVMTMIGGVIFNDDDVRFTPRRRGWRAGWRGDLLNPYFLATQSCEWSEWQAGWALYANGHGEPDCITFYDPYGSY